MHENCKKSIEYLCKKENLVFLTKSDGRKPTLYFSSGKIVGRIRQEHKDGAKISLYEENRFRIFFTGPDAKGKLKNKRNNLPELAKEDDNISTDPQKDWKVLEYSTENKNPDGEVENNWHFSQGVVQTDDLQKITQKDIDQMIACICKRECHS